MGKTPGEALREALREALNKYYGGMRYENSSNEYTIAFIKGLNAAAPNAQPEMAIHKHCNLSHQASLARPE